MGVDLNDSMAALAREEAAFKRGFDAGVEHQKTAAPTPKAKQYRDALREAAAALRSAGESIGDEYPASGERILEAARKAEAVLK